MDNRLSTLEMHIKNLRERADQTAEKLMINDKLTPDDIVELRKKQEQYHLALSWLINVKNEVFPPKILTNGNGLH